MTSLKTGEVFPVSPETPKELLPGAYQLRARESGWISVREKLVNLTADGNRKVFDIASRASSQLRDALVAKIPGAHSAGTVDFSESLGPMANEDLGLWLSIIGASRILGPGEFSKLSALSLQSFDDVMPGGCPIYVLAGVENADRPVTVAIRDAGADGPQRAAMNVVAGVPGLFELRADPAPGLHVVHLQIGDLSPLATATYCLPNRTTLFTVAVEPAGKARIHQFMLPLPHLRSYLTPQEQGNQPINFLQGIRFTTLAQLKLGRRRSPKPQGEATVPPDPKLQEDQLRWAELLAGKWLDPVMAIMASYEILRNRREPANIDFAGIVVPNLRQCFSTLPDVEILAKLAQLEGEAYREPTATPLFLAGVQALQNPEAVLPFPRSKLDYTGPWVTWVGV